MKKKIILGGGGGKKQRASGRFSAQTHTDTHTKTFFSKKAHKRESRCPTLPLGPSPNLWTDPLSWAVLPVSPGLRSCTLPRAGRGGQTGLRAILVFLGFFIDYEGHHSIDGWDWTYEAIMSGVSSVSCLVMVVLNELPLLIQ